MLIKTTNGNTICFTTIKFNNRFSNHIYITFLMVKHIIIYIIVTQKIPFYNLKKYHEEVVENYMMKKIYITFAEADEEIIKYKCM